MSPVASKLNKLWHTVRRYPSGLGLSHIINHCISPRPPLEVCIGFTTPHQGSIHIYSWHYYMIAQQPTTHQSAPDISGSRICLQKDQPEGQPVLLLMKHSSMMLLMMLLSSFHCLMKRKTGGLRTRKLFARMVS